ncbi:MAG: undecaprenyldiphospho-muramoylpentapeptide beta-N-acetylglucosaminyltransferase [Candidatus Eremiobacteraeota bacterium]|nr:undecaprenyldiphospho-muramoylpentapeptide beta-N-acetylglucosaminyltransferase [Candidatus Eremiobacteraeota bacterium]
MTVVFAGGGTGGHLYPAIAIADALRSRGVTPEFVGSADRLETTIVPNAGYPLHAIASRPLVRRVSPEFVRTIVANAAGMLQSVRLLRRLAPRAVIAPGGYVCFPVVAAARTLRWLRLYRGPIALFEPNAQPGLTNRLLAPLVDEVWGAFAEGDARFTGKYVVTGVPVRSSLRVLPERDEAVRRIGLLPERKTLLVMGGSQGARAINDAVTALIASGGIPDGWQVLHVTGEREYDRVRERLAKADTVVRPYLHDLSDAYAAADLVLARAGASTLGELAALGKAAILVPYPHAAEDHQAANAARFAAAGAAVVLIDRQLAAGQLRETLAQTVDRAHLAALQAAAAQLRGNDPIATIVARVEALLSRMSGP